MRGVVGIEEAAGRGLAVDEDGLGDAFGWGEELDAAGVLTEDAEVRGGVLEAELIICGSTDGGVAVLEPLEGYEG